MNVTSVLFSLSGSGITSPLLTIKRMQGKVLIAESKLCTLLCTKMIPEFNNLSLNYPYTLTRRQSHNCFIWCYYKRKVGWKISRNHADLEPFLHDVKHLLRGWVHRVEVNSFLVAQIQQKVSFSKLVRGRCVLAAH